jgi:hypothetical protein
LPSLIHRCCGRPVIANVHQAFGDQLFDLGYDIGREPLLLELGDIVVELIALLLDDNLVCGAVERLEREPTAVLVVDVA